MKDRPCWNGLTSTAMASSVRKSVVPCVSTCKHKASKEPAKTVVLGKVGKVGKVAAVRAAEVAVALVK